MTWRDSRSFVCCAARTNALRLRRAPGVHEAPKDVKPVVLLIQLAAVDGAGRSRDRQCVPPQRPRSIAWIEGPIE